MSMTETECRVKLNLVDLAFTNPKRSKSNSISIVEIRYWTELLGDLGHFPLYPHCVSVPQLDPSSAFEVAVVLITK